MKVSGLSPSTTHKLLFKRSCFKQVPQHSGCYVLARFDDEILYIGLAVNLCNRFQQHLDNPEKTGSTENGKVFWFHFLEYDIKNLNKLERTWLNAYVAEHGFRPVLNKMDSPVG